jgi:hypothetical protein
VSFCSGGTSGPRTPVRVRVNDELVLDADSSAQATGPRAGGSAQAAGLGRPWNQQEAPLSRACFAQVLLDPRGDRFELGLADDDVVDQKSFGG